MSFGLTSLQFIAAADSTSSFIVLGIFVGLFLLMIISARFAGKGRRRGSGSGSYNKMAFRREGRKRGLENHHIQLLSRAIKTQDISQPMRLYEHGGFLNKVLQRVIFDVDTSNRTRAEKESIKAVVFQIKSKISNAKPSSKTVSNTKGIRQGQEFTIYSRTHSPGIAVVLANTATHLTIEAPELNDGTIITFKPGTELKIRYINNQKKVNFFMTIVKDVHRINGVDCLLVAHSENVETVQLRKSPRKVFTKPAYFQHVEVVTEGKGRNQSRRAVVNSNRRYLGQMEDISAGGCALFSRTPLRKGGFIKIDFDLYSNQGMSVFGRIKSTQTVRPLGAIMHVQFTRVSKKHLNEIQSYVYGFETEE
jgi:c-di-GMP-binding flagellar brake protein YcgR